MIQVATRSTTLFALLAGLLWPTFIRGQALAGRFYAEKQSFFVGEPVFIDFEITNTGDQPAWIDQRMGEPCIEPDPIEVEGAKHQGFGWDTSFGCFGGVAGSCAGGATELKPGEERTARIFLSAGFRLDHAGTYQVHARRSLPTYPSGEIYALRAAATEEFSSDFQITLVQGSEGELKAAFQPYVEDASTPDEGDHWLAVWAINEMAPAFLEDLILKLAEMPNRANPRALLRLNTLRSKQKLAELAEKSNDAALQQGAIQALAETRDRSYLPVLTRIAGKSTDGNRDFAIWGAGLFGEDAIPLLVSMLSNPDVDARVAAVRGLGLTTSCSAVSILIAALQNSDEAVQREAPLSLAELTHRSITKEPWNEPPSADESRRWHNWWLKNELTSPIYGTDNCVQPQPLD
jgi:HEAT repeat protein